MGVAEELLRRLCGGEEEFPRSSRGAAAELLKGSWGAPGSLQSSRGACGAGGALVASLARRAGPDARDEMEYSHPLLHSGAGAPMRSMFRVKQRVHSLYPGACQTYWHNF